MLSEKGLKDQKLFKTEEGLDKEVVEKIELVEWLSTNYKEYGCKLEFVSNKSQEGSQFCKGFGGMGGFLRYRCDFLDEDPFAGAFINDSCEGRADQRSRTQSGESSASRSSLCARTHARTQYTNALGAHTPSKHLRYVQGWIMMARLFHRRIRTTTMTSTLTTSCKSSYDLRCSVAARARHAWHCCRMPRSSDETEVLSVRFENILGCACKFG